jgi:outer membrane protein TolC
MATTLSGCSALSPAVPTTLSKPTAPTTVVQATLGLPVPSGDVRPVVHQQAEPNAAALGATETLATPRPLPANLPAEQSATPFAGRAELSADAVVDQVLARSPSLAEMVAAWHAAQARFPQVTSLEDPMFAATIGPGTFAPDDNGLEFAFRLEVSQKLPYPGKLKLRGANALAEAAAAGHIVGDIRLQLAEAARVAFYDYYLAERGLEVNADSLDLLRKFKANAETRYKTGLVPQQDILQADVEIGREQERRLGLDQMRKIAIARINTLMHLSPDLEVPPSPQRVSLPATITDAPALRTLALGRRPDLLALAERIRAEEAQLGLAHKEFYPDFEPFFMYDRFMGNTTDSRDLAAQIGLRTNLPAYKARRYGAVAEAEARLAQRRAELAKQTDQVNYQVQEAYEKVVQGAKSVELYEKTILPAARANVESAQAAYITGKIPFLTLIEAQRSQVGLRDRYYESSAEYFRRRATLERVVGGPLSPEQTAGPAQRR